MGTPHALRWYNHIKSFAAGMKQFPKASKDGSAYTSGAAAAASKAEDDDDEEKKRITEERLKAYHEKKSKKPALIAKTSVLLDIKPWDDETDMDKKLQLMCVVEDEKVSIDELCEQIQEFE